MAFSGRKRKVGRRKPSGDIIIPCPPRDHGTPEMQAQRLAAFGDPRAKRELICPVERVRKALTQEQFWAASSARRSYALYCIAIGSPHLVSGQLQDYIQGSGQQSMTHDDAIEVVKRHRELIEAISKYSRRGLLEVERLMRGTAPRDIEVLRSGLTAAADHLGFTQKRRRAA